MRILLFCLFLYYVIGQNCPVNLRNATDFVILARTQITNSGTGTNVTGEVGTTPGVTINAFPPGILNGNKHFNDLAAQLAMIDANAIFNTIVSYNCNQTLTTNIGPATLTPAVYCTTGDLNFVNNINFNCTGRTTTSFYFKVGRHFSQNNGRNVFLINCDRANIFYAVGTSTGGNVNIGNTLTTYGTFIAKNTISVSSSSVIFGRLFAVNDRVTLNTDTINIVTSNACATTCCLPDGSCSVISSSNCISLGGVSGSGSLCGESTCLKAIIPTICKVDYNNGTCLYGLSYFNFNQISMSLSNLTSFFIPSSFNQFLPKTYDKDGNVFVSSFFANCSISLNWTIITNVGGTFSATSANASTCTGACCEKGFCNLKNPLNCTGVFSGYLSKCNNSLCTNTSYITPIFHCTIVNSNGTCTSYFGYNNTLNQTLFASTGTHDNIILQNRTWFLGITGPTFNYQINTFKYGYFPYAFFVLYTCSGGPISWTVSDTQTNIHVTVNATNIQTCTGTCCNKGSCSVTLPQNCPNNGFYNYLQNCSTGVCPTTPVINLFVGCTIYNTSTKICTTTWGYNNTSPNIITILPGSFNNFIEPFDNDNSQNNPNEIEQVTSFLPGYYSNAFTTVEDCTEGPFTWNVTHLGFNAAVTSTNYSSCEGYCCNSTFCTTTNDSSCSMIQFGTVVWGGFGTTCSQGQTILSNTTFPCQCTQQTNNGGVCGKPNDLNITVDCIINYGNGTCLIRNSYNNTNSEIIRIPTGINNRWAGTIYTGNLLTQFLPGFQRAAEVFTFNCSSFSQRILQINQTFNNN